MKVCDSPNLISSLIVNHKKKLYIYKRGNGTSLLLKVFTYNTTDEVAKNLIKIIILAKLKDGMEGTECQDWTTKTLAKQVFFVDLVTLQFLS